MKKEIQRAVLTCALVGGVAAGTWALRAARGRHSGPAGAMQSAAKVEADGGSPNVLPSFPTPEQARAYYGSVTDGERKSLAIIDDALAKARARGKADPAYIATLTRMRMVQKKRLDENTRAAGRQVAR